MTKDIFTSSLLAKGFTPSAHGESMTALLTKPAPGMGGEIGYALTADGSVHKVQYEDEFSPHQWTIKTSAKLTDFEESLSGQGKWVLKPGCKWVADQKDPIIRF